MNGLGFSFKKKLRKLSRIHRTVQAVHLAPVRKLPGGRKVADRLVRLDTPRFGPFQPGGIQVDRDDVVTDSAPPVVDPSPPIWAGPDVAPPAGGVTLEPSDDYDGVQQSGPVDIPSQEDDPEEVEIADLPSMHPGYAFPSAGKKPRNPYYGAAHGFIYTGGPSMHPGLAGVTENAGALWDYLKQTASGAYQVTRDAAGKFVTSSSRMVMDLRDLLRKFVAVKRQIPGAVSENEQQRATVARYIDIAKRRGDSAALKVLTPLRDQLTTTAQKLNTVQAEIRKGDAETAKLTRETGLPTDGLGAVPIVIPIIAIVALAAVIGVALYHAQSVVGDVVKDRQRLSSVEKGKLPPEVYAGTTKPPAGAGGGATGISVGVSWQTIALVGAAGAAGWWLLNGRKRGGRS